METSRRRIAVLGGGISGLTAAYVLARARQAGAPIEEFLIEASPRLGGVIQTERVEGFVIEAGPDSFLTEKPEAAALCRELGLGESLLGSNDSRRLTYMLHGGRLVPFPEGLALMVPTRAWPILKSPLLPLRSKLAMAAEWMMSPRARKRREDESVADLVLRHFGKAMVENIADPLLAAVYGGDAATLSARSVLPRFWKMEQEHGSLIRGVLRSQRERQQQAIRNSAAGCAIAAPIFTTLKDGLGQMIETLKKHLDGARLFTGRRIEAIETEQLNFETHYQIRCGGGVLHQADAIIFALPTFECARLLEPCDPALAEFLRSIKYTSAITVAFGYEAQAAGKIPPGFGFLVPRQENRRLLACTFVHGKFSHRVPAGHALLRCFLGGVRDPEVLKLSDEAVVALVRKELAAILKVDAEPLLARVHRWPSAMPQYLVGHDDVVGHIQTRLQQHPQFALAGNAYSGIGISDCLRTARAAAQQVLERVGK